MRIVVLALLAACHVSMPPLVEGKRWEYPEHPICRSPIGGGVEVRGRVERPGTLAYSPGMSLRLALLVAGADTRDDRMLVTLFRENGSTRSNALQLERDDLDLADSRGDRYELPLEAIRIGAAPDPELAPGDVIVVSLPGDLRDRTLAVRHRSMFDF